eukprot:12851484-Prorocentrum_lima.AAC.1
MELLKALERKWAMSKPEHLGPVGRYEKLKFIGVMISRKPSTVGGHEEGTFFVGQGHYVLEVLERFSSSMHYKNRTNPGEPESFASNQNYK